MLNIQSLGDQSNIPDLLIVHGLFGSARNWRAIARNLSTDRQVHVVDMRNHGDSFWDADNSYEAMANDLAKVIQSLGVTLDILGHSMGGKAGMVLALTYPELVNRLLVADIAPAKYAHDQSFNLAAMQLLPLNSFTRRSEADVILAKTLPDKNIRAFFLQSLKISETGNSWQLNLNALSTNMDKIIGFPIINSEFSGETLFVRGGRSQYILNSHLADIKTLFPNYNLTTIESAGHWLHVDTTRAFLLAVKDFFVRK